MVLRRPLIALTLVAAVIVTLLVVQRVSPEMGDAPLQSLPPTASMPAASAAPPGLADRISPTYDGPIYDPAVARAPTRDKPQAKLWFHDGLWWGSLFDDEREAFTIWWLDADRHEWMNTGTLVDDRPFARQDVLWDGELLAIVSHGSDQTSARHAVQVRRLTYDAGRRAWVQAPNFPVTITEAGVEAASLARDGSGRLWAAFIESERVAVASAEPSDLVWEAAVYLEAESASVDIDQAAIVSVGDDIGIMWTSQARDGVFFARHRTGQPLDVWEAPETALAGVNAADDHLSINSLAGPDAGTYVYAAVKTSLDEAENFNSLAPQVLLLRRSPEGAWTQHTYGRVEDHHTRPILVLDAERRDVLIFATSPFDGGMIYLKRSSLDRIAFPVGLGTPVITADGDPRINNATATHQTVTGASGLVVLAADDTVGSYLHVELGVEPGQADQPPEITGAREIVNATFDGMRPEIDLETQGFALTPVGRGSAVVASDAQDWVARVASTDGEPVRICRPFAPVDAGTLTAIARVRIEHAPTGDAPIVAVRGVGEEVTGLRILADGQWAYRVGANRDLVGTTWAPGAWYSVTIEVDIDAQTYTAEVRDNQEDVIFTVGPLPWQGDPAVIDEVCMQAPRGATVATMLIDELVVMQTEEG